MQKLWLNALSLSPAILGLFMVAVPAMSSEVPVNQAPTINQSSSFSSTEIIGQVTSVSQLSDVQPTDWAFAALQSLVERYGCIAGYPNQTYRGNRALTRYEFAAGLNACLDRINELIATSTADLVNKEDLATLQKLQEEYASELQTVRGRVDALEAQTAAIESQQFSTTTKLRGEAVFALASVFGSDRAINSDAENSGGSRAELDENVIFADRVRLNFDSSFTGKDRLRVRLQARNITSFNTAVTGTNQTRLGFDGNESNNVSVSALFYRFPVGDSTMVSVATEGLEYIDEVPGLSRNFDSSGSGALSRFGRYNPIYRAAEGPGVIINHKFNNFLTLTAGYVVPSGVGNDPSDGNGIFNGSYSALGQVTVQPLSQLSLAFTYVNAYYTGGSGVSGSTGTGFANNPFNGARTSVNNYSVTANYKLSSKFTVTAWGNYTNAQAENTAVARSNADIWHWAVQLGFPDLGREGNFGGIVFGVPPYVADNQFVAGNNRRQDDDISYHLEAFYRYKLNDNIAVTPGLITIFNPEGNSSNPNIYVGVVRTTFSF
ncbi:iron uptake porin [Nostoc sp. FACHB-152]|uniref:iron uptake porin n=1 Tax=unclassified Nostoc TaxID=2593658 RepID=UPI0016831AFE|nr:MULTISPECIES: iron uptake porin [unclassified Nostoc]MBD2447796.1 iron uptake porin [Nostoc sp. FACHB-152]MBD2467087.1 iron uptake porin [Nostoc sp. FACHB-145]